MVRVFGKRFVRRLGAAAATAALTAAVVTALGASPAAAATTTCHPFPDVKASNPHCENIAWLKGEDITKPSDGMYHPTAQISRGSMVAFLFRLTHPGKSSPKCTGKPFPDVPVSNVFCGYISWAADSGVAQGYSDGSFGPGNGVTRGAMSAFLRRIAATGGAPACSVKPFADVPVDSTFCGTITWMIDNQITYGIGDGTRYGTTQIVTRQQMASFLHRIYDFMHGAASPTTATGVLSTLAVKGKAPMTGYDREGDFGPAWTDNNGDPLGHNGCDTRNDILKRDLTNITYRSDDPGCTVATGTLIDPYTAKTIHFVRGVGTSTAVQIDHVVALGNAWQSGAQKLSYTARVNVANDPLNLLAVDGPTNESKGKSNAAEWLPPNKSYRCSYVARQIAVKAKYDLWVTAPEKAAMQQVLAKCPGQKVPTEGQQPPPVTPKPPPTDSCEPGYSPCLPIVDDLNCSDIPDSKKPIRVTGSDPYQLDRDGDGWGCTS